MRREKDYDIKWQNNDERITISKSYFEHLLNCLANQKFVGELPVCGDALAEGEENYKNVQKECQDAIDKAWREGMFIMSLEYKKNSKYQEIMKKCSDYMENMNIAEVMKKDLEENKDDPNIDFKWTQLLNQEIWMWASLCCGQDAIIDCENEKYEVGQVDKKDFDYIVKRRGFTPKLISTLRDILKEIGIGNNL